MLITLTIVKFNDKIKKLNEELNTEQSQSTIPSIPSIEIKKQIKERLTSKINELQKSVLAIVPYSDDNLEKITKIENKGNSTTAAKFGQFRERISSVGKKVSRVFSRSLDAKTHIDNILRDLSVVNSFFIFYNSQFEWLIRQTEMIINHKYKTDNKNDEILFEIWTSIFTNEAYNEYMGQQVEDTANLKTVFDDLGQDAKTKLDIGVDKAVEETILNSSMDGDGQQENGQQVDKNGGGKKTKKRHPRKIKKPKRKYTHRKMFIKNTFIPVKI
jgi:hypothetical protein